MNADAKPLLLLDVDGPLNPFRATRPGGYTAHRLPSDGMTFNVWLNHDHGRMLLDLADEHQAELVWCTTWEHDANMSVGPHIGLPELPVIELGHTADQWKFGAVIDYAAGRSLAWLDDDFPLFPREREWFFGRRAGTPTLLHLVDPAVGLTAEDLVRVGDWFGALRTNGHPGGC